MTNCIQCKKEFEAKRTDAKFCSPQCRKASWKGTDKLSVPISVPGTDNGTDKGTDENGKKYRDYTAEELTDGIHSYEHDDWVRSPEYLEQTRRQKTWTIKRLEETGHYVPHYRLPNVLE